MSLPLWQVQIVGEHARSVNYRILQTAREALGSHPNEAIRTLDDLETIQHVRITVNVPPMNGPVDPDGVGRVNWVVALYVGGDSPQAGLDFIQFMLDYKMTQGLLVARPRTLVQTLPEPIPDLGISGPWTILDSQMPSGAHPPFTASPPKGRRHVIAQLEVNAAEPAEMDGQSDDAAEDEKKYLLCFYGNLFHFRDRFDQEEIPGATLQLGQAEDQREYVRFVDLVDTTPSKLKVTRVLQDILKGMPVFLINMVGGDDAMAQWVMGQESIVTERPSSA